MTPSRGAGLGPAPLDVPLSYPGPRADRPFRLRDDVVAVLPSVRAVALTRARLDAGGTPVLAIGSNASPAQLAAKFSASGQPADLVGLPVRVAGVQTGLSAHLARSGYWPFAPVHRDASAGPGVVCVLDGEQLAVLDGTEPNYRRTCLDPVAHPLVAAAGTSALEVGPLEVYVSVHGVVDDARLPSWSEPPPTQMALLAALLGVVPLGLPPGSTPADLSRALRTVDGFAARATTALQHSLAVRAAGLAGTGTAQRSVGTPSSRLR